MIKEHFSTPSMKGYLLLLQALRLFEKMYPLHGGDEIQQCTEKAVNLIESIRAPHGSCVSIQDVVCGNTLVVSSSRRNQQRVFHQLHLSSIVKFAKSIMLIYQGWEIPV